MANSKAFRVYRVPENLRRAVVATRQAQNVNTKAVLSGAITESLPKVVIALQKLGFRMSKSKVRPVRWPIGGDDDLLGALKVASAQTGIDQSKLLQVSLALFCEETKTPRKRANKASPVCDLQPEDSSKEAN